MSKSLAQLLAQRGFEALFHGGPDAVFVVDLHGRFVRANDEFIRLLGYGEGDLQAMNFADVVHPDDFPRVKVELDRCAEGEGCRYRTTIVTRSGSAFSVDVTNIPVKDEEGTVSAVIGVAREAGDSEERARLIDRSAAALRITGRLASVGAWSIEVGTGEMFTSEELNRVLGTERSTSLHYLTAIESHPEPDRTRVREAMEECMNSGAPIDITSAVLDADGNSLDVRTVGEAVRDSSGAILRVQGAFYDVSSILATELAAARLEMLLDTTLNQMTTGIAFINRDWEFTFVNETAQRYMRNTAETMIGANFWDLYPEREGSKFDPVYRQAMDEGLVASSRDYYPPFDKWFEVTAYPTDDGIAIHISDVTQDQWSRIQLQQGTELLKSQAALLDATRDAIIVRGLDHRIRYWNRGAEVLYGWTAEEVIGQSVREVFYPDSSRFDQAHASLMRDGYWTGENTQLAKDGHTIHADCRWQLLRDDEGEPESVLVVNSDITGWKAEEQRRNRASRMESLGTLAGGIAHDLNNVLTPILMGAQLLAADEKDDGRRAMLNSIATGVNRGADMIRQVLSFARGEEGERREVTIAEIFEELAVFYRDTLPRSIKVKVDLPANLPPIMADSTQILQVLMNLVTNAAHAMPRGGKLGIRARAADGRSGVDGAPVVGKSIIIEVEDSGAGMSAETVLKVFEPFFTTKDLGNGTGLGLSTSMATARSHGGHMEVYSEPGRGSRFQLHLPTMESGQRPVDKLPVASATFSATGTGQLILVVDDEATIRQLACQTLEANGYRTVQASDGLKAIELVEKMKGAVDLVFTDMMMAGVGGSTTAAYLREHHPHVALVAASGLTSNQEIAQAAHPRLTHFLSKPFTADELLAAVGSTLETWGKS